ncbi:hypothetical protein ISS03_03695 [Patescibacteria group bacterium]|nr:hypothetical protein [Patescibacteria group bacterium]
MSLVSSSLYKVSLTIPSKGKKMLYVPVLVLRDPAITGFDLAIAMPNKKGQFCRKIDNISDQELQTTRALIASLNFIEGSSKLIFFQPKVTMGELKNYKRMTIVKVDDQLVKEIEGRVCDDCDNSAVQSLSGHTLELNAKAGLKNRIPPKVHFPGQLNGVFGFVYLVDKEMHKRIKSETKKSTTKDIILPCSGHNKMVIVDIAFIKDVLAS